MLSAIDILGENSEQLKNLSNFTNLNCCLNKIKPNGDSDSDSSKYESIVKLIINNTPYERIDYLKTVYL